MKRLPVVAALIQKDGKILLARRPEGRARSGLWEFPGGKIEPEERPEEALYREIKEELGIEIKVGPILAEVEHDYPEIKIQLLCYEGEILRGTPVPLEGQKISWFRPNDIGNLELAPADRKLWQKLSETAALEKRLS